MNSSDIVAALEREIKAAFMAGAQRIATEARSNAPVLKQATAERVPGALRNAISLETPTAVGGKLQVQVGIDPSAFYGGFQELGFHAGRARSDGRLVPGLHFMRRAFDANKQTIASDVVSRVAVVINKANE